MKNDFAGPKKPSMKRRMEGHDYTRRGIILCLENMKFCRTVYFITSFSHNRLDQFFNVSGR